MRQTFWVAIIAISFYSLPSRILAGHADLFQYDEKALDAELADLSQLDQTLEQHPQLTLPELITEQPQWQQQLHPGLLPSNGYLIEPPKDMKLASGMAFGEFFLLLWWLPVHRMYLGTSNKTIALYVVTCGGCGIITIIDAVSLYITKEYDQFVDNPQFIMW